jgi:CubicO group peptidase (beta-lactamase class C family)
MIDDSKVERLLARVRREVDEGLSPAVAVAIGFEGEIVVEAAFGDADVDSRFIGYSSTKALVAAAIWRLLDSGAVAVDALVTDYLPEFGTNGKEEVTVEHLLTHTGGFPWAPLGPDNWETSASRREAMQRWRAVTEPGSTFVYHPTAGHWVLAEIITAVTGKDHADAIEELVTAPLGLPRLLGIPVDEQDGIIDTVGIGELPTPEEVEAAYGFKLDIAEFLSPDVALGALLSLNHPSARAVGVPGGGGIFRARDIAAFYQGLLHDPKDMWSDDALYEGTQHVRMTLPDMLGIPASRTLGLVVAGSDGHSHQRGMGRTVSARAFGHNGAGGQLAFADPESGLSVGYLTAGLDQNIIRQQRRDTAIASLAADLLAD